MPKELGNLTMLQLLYIGYNNFEGVIPKEIFALRSLRFLNLQSNRLSGHMPKELGNLTMLQFLYIGYNNFGGVIPKEIFALRSLRSLNLQSNRLSGHLPKELGNLTMLQFLYIGYNNFGGVIPKELGKLHMLEEEIAEAYLGKTIKDAVVTVEWGRRGTPEIKVTFEVDANGILNGAYLPFQAASNHEMIIFYVKRLIGRKFEDKEVQRDMKLVPYKIVNKDGKPYIQVKMKDGETNKGFQP
nr:probable leucine-rich repeat receptor-like protein kinase At1g35710 [Ipomoea batatas]